MNILILTPDRVGSTLLQRLITIYANLADPTKLTINLHELTNGLVKYYNDKFGKEVLGKKEKSWGYYQSLSEVVDLLSNSTHDVTSRLAYYHIKNRKDSLGDQLSFYEYLNENFYIIAARRNNIFEHALSWAIAVESKKLNVYSFEEKYQIFNNMFVNGININKNTLLKYLNSYIEYLNWSDNHFKINSYFNYENDLPNIENYILNLTPFKGLSTCTWENKFNISWDDWNRMHYLLSLVLFEISFTPEEKKFMADNIKTYKVCRTFIQDMQDDGILVSGIPIKLHTLKEKINLIENFDQTLITYNDWSKGIFKDQLTMNKDNLLLMADKETTDWKFGNLDSASKLTYADIPRIELLKSDLKYSE